MNDTRVRRRYPLQDLASAMGTSVAGLGSALGVSGSTLNEYRDRGVTEKVGDRLATKAGFATYEVWPEMLTHVLEDHDAAVEKERSKAKARNATAARRRYAEDDEFRARRLAEMRAYKEATRRAQRLYAQRHREANRERLAAQRRANYEANREQILERQRAYDRARAAARRSTQHDEQEAA